MITEGWGLGETVGLTHIRELICALMPLRRGQVGAAGRRRHVSGGRVMSKQGGHSSALWSAEFVANKG